MNVSRYSRIPLIRATYLWLSLTSLQVALCAGLVNARTWVVAPEGTRNSLTLQAGLDIARPGDVVELVPGRYDQWSMQTIGWTRRMIATVGTSQILLRGQSREHCIIGPEGPRTTIADDPIGIMIGYGVRGLVIENLTVENLGGGIVPTGEAHIRNVTLRGCEIAANLREAAGVLIEDSTFANNREGIETTKSTDVTIRRCSFTNNSIGCWFLRTTIVRVEDCMLTGVGPVIYFGTDSRGTVVNCEVFNFLTAGIQASGNAEIELYGNRVHDGPTSLHAQSSSIVSGSGNDFRAGSSSTLAFYSGATAHLFGNHFNIDSPEYAVILRFYNDPLEPVTVDLRNNYWHTTDASLVADKILDSEDQPDQYGTVLYLPMAQGAVPTEPLSFGRLKSTYR